MGRKLHYISGSFYRTSDRTGFPQRAGSTRKEWNGLIVEDKVWEPRQPQDLVKGVPDKQSVEDPRPLGENIYVGPYSQQITANAAIGAVTLLVQSIAGFYNGASVGVVTDFDNGWIFKTTVSGVPAGFTITLAAALPYPVSSGNLIINYKPSPGVEPGLP